MQLGSGVVWPLCLLVVRLLRPAFALGSLALSTVAAPLSHLFSAVGGARGAAGVARQVAAINAAKPTAGRAGTLAKVTAATVNKAVSWSTAAQNTMESTAKTRETLQSIAVGASEVMAVMAVSQVSARPKSGAAVAGGRDSGAGSSSQSAMADVDNLAATGDGNAEEGEGEEEEEAYQTASEGE